MHFSIFSTTLPHYWWLYQASVLTQMVCQLQIQEFLLPTRSQIWQLSAYFDFEYFLIVKGWALIYNQIIKCKSECTTAERLDGTAGRFGQTRIFNCFKFFQIVSNVSKNLLPKSKMFHLDGEECWASSARMKRKIEKRSTFFV